MKGRKAMSLFKKNKKSKINSAILDLRNYSPQALMNIKEINSAITFIPDVQDSAFYEAFSMIAVKNIANQIRLAPEIKISTTNGIAEMTNATCNYDKTLHIVNGAAVAYNLDNTKAVDVLINGILVYDDTCKINIVTDNGISYKTDFVIKSAKLFPNKITVDVQFLENVCDSTVICSANKIFIDSDVSLDLLKSKKLFFASGNKIICSKDIIGYITSISAVGNKITTYEEEHKSSRKTKNKYRDF